MAGIVPGSVDGPGPPPHPHAVAAGIPLDEAETWPRAARGEAAARERLGALALEAARRALSARGVRGAELDDLVQESARSTLAYLASGAAAPTELRSFLKWRALGVLSDHRKKLRAAAVIPVREDPPEPAAADPGPDRGLRSGEVERALADCRARLSAEQRVVLEMRYEGGREAEAIARELGLHRNTVHVRVFRALQSLRECLGRKGVAPGDLG